MSLKDKKSLFDRNQTGVQGNPVGQNPPSEGNFFTDEGATSSPFDSRDHLVDLLTKNVKSDNSGQTYFASPNKSDFQDLNGGVGQLGETLDNGVLSNRKGVYKNTGPADGRY